MWTDNKPFKGKGWKITTEQKCKIGQRALKISKGQRQIRTKIGQLGFGVSCRPPPAKRKAEKTGVGGAVFLNIWADRSSLWEPEGVYLYLNRSPSNTWKDLFPFKLNNIKFCNNDFRRNTSRRECNKEQKMVCCCARVRMNNVAADVWTTRVLVSETDPVPNTEPEMHS